MAEPMESSVVPVGGLFEGTVGARLATGEGWWVAEAQSPDGRPALVLDESTLADMLPLEERVEYGQRVLVFESAEGRAAYAASHGWIKTSPSLLRGPRTLLGHLAATRQDVFRQAEVLCTISLAWVLDHSDGASQAFGRLVGVDGRLRWRAEDLDADIVGRPDLVGRDARGSPRVTVEAKLGAPLDRDQLLRFLREGRQLVVLVPGARVDGARDSLKRWGIDAPVVSWDQLLGTIRGAVGTDPASAADLAQLTDLYHHVERTWIPPFSASDLRDPVGAGRFEDLVKLVDQTVTELAGLWGYRTYAMHRRPPKVEPRRYVIIETVDGIGSTPALGVFPSIADQLGSPVALMIHHRATRRAPELVARWVAANLPIVSDRGNTFLPLHVPPDQSQFEMVDSCAEQAQRSIRLLLDRPQPPGT